MRTVNAGFEPTTMQNETTQKIQKELSVGESLLWSGRPKQGLLLRGSDALLIPFSLLWGGFAIFWEFSAYSSGAPAFFLLFGSVFVLIGLYFIVGRFFVDALMRKHTYYGVTNDRVLILSGFPVRKTKSLNLKTLTDISFSNKADGTGSITFGTQHPMAGWMSGLSWPGMGPYQSPGFDLVKDVKAVYEVIREASRKAA